MAIYSEPNTAHKRNTFIEWMIFSRKVTVTTPDDLKHVSPTDLFHQNKNSKTKKNGPIRRLHGAISLGRALENATQPGHRDMAYNEVGSHVELLHTSFRISYTFHVG